MTFGKRPIKLKNKTGTIKPASKPANASSTNTTKSSSNITPPAPLPDATLTSKKSQIEKAKTAARRSSFGQRGKRAKGSFEQGECVMPHESVSSDKLYRHIDTELPEPHRARHLLIWCARRAAVPVQQDPKGKGKAKVKGNGLNDADSALVASVQDRIVRQLMDLSIDIPLYDISAGPFAADLGKGKKGKEQLAEDPVNLKNREVKEKLAKAEERCVCLRFYQFYYPDICGDMTARETKTPCGQK
jgi:kinetochore protein Mis13/DSN1